MFVKGVYITTEQARDLSMSPDSLYSGDPERAIALVAVRALILERGSALIGKDLDSIHGV